MPIRHLSLATIAVALVFLVACTTPAEPEPQSSSEPPAVATEKAITEAEAFVRAEEAVWTCMAEAGFAYQRRPYIDDGRRSDVAEQVLAGLYFDDAKDWGYRGSFLAVTSFAPMGGPKDQLTPAEHMAYDDAYLGRPHSHTDGSADHEGDHSHQSGGCKEVGEKTFAEQSILGSTDDERVIGEFFVRLASSEEWESFEATWISCMRVAGHDPSETSLAPGFRGTAMAAYTTAKQLEFARAAQAVMDGPPSRIAESPRLDSEWFSSMLSTNSELSEVFAAEVRAAEVDAVCRASSRSKIEQHASGLAAELGMEL